MRTQDSRLARDWWPALADGLQRAGAAGVVAESDVAMAFFGDLFHSAGHLLAVGDPRYTAADVGEGFEHERPLTWCQAGAPPSRPAPNASSPPRSTT